MRKAGDFKCGTLVTFDRGVEDCHFCKIVVVNSVYVLSHPFVYLQGVAGEAV